MYTRTPLASVRNKINPSLVHEIRTVYNQKNALIKISNGEIHLLAMFVTLEIRSVYAEPTKIRTVSCL